MADYIYMMESRLTPDQQRAVALVQELARAQEMNVYLTGGAIRDLISGFPIRDLDFTVQGNALKLQRELEKAGAVLQGVDEDLRSMYVLLPGNVRSEIAMARSERYEKPGRPPEIASGTIIDDLRRRDFTINAMALSLNPGSRGLLLDPFNGVADIEAKLIRILHNYAFYEEPSRLIRATRFTTRFHFALEERTQARFDAAREGNYIDNISDRAIGYEIEQVAYEDDPLHLLRLYEKEGWLKVLNPHWSASKVDTASLGAVAQDQTADAGPGLHAGRGAGGDVLPHPPPGRPRHRGHAAADAAQELRRDLAQAGRRRQRTRQAPHRQGSGHAVAGLEAAFHGASRDHPVP